jgi:hypothetical protein
MRTWRAATALGISLLWAVAVPAQNTSDFFPSTELRPGLKGVGRTIFEGDKVEEFQVEILGVLKNLLAPKRDVILARLSGGPLEKTGVIAGMSGSPVYVDGKLVGAIALSFPFSKEPLAGITPIGEMLGVAPTAAPPAASRPTPAMNLNYRISRDAGEGARLVPDADDPLTGLATLFSADGVQLLPDNLRLPLKFGGFSPSAVEASASLLRRLGFEPMLGGALAASPTDTPVKGDIQAGSMISMLLVRGDLNVNADCTVTYRKGNQLYACGHRFLLAGPADIPFAKASVVATVPNLASSFKIDALGPLAGVIHQDRFSAIYGTVGDKAQGIPVRVQVESSLNKKEDYKFEMVQESFLSPLLLNLAVTSALSVTERQLGASTIDLKGKIRLSGGEDVDLDDVLSSDVNTAGAAGAAAANPLSIILANNFPDLRVEGIDLSFVSLNERRSATLEQAWSSKSEVRPGDHIEVTALLRKPTGETLIQKLPLDIPESVTDKMLSVVVGGGSAINALQFRLIPVGTNPRDLHQLVKALNKMRRNNRVYALLMAPQRSFILQGDEYPSPPPSLLQTFLADPAVSSSVTFSGTSVIGDVETDPTPYAIRGQKTLFLKVTRTGS